MDMSLQNMMLIDEYPEYAKSGKVAQSSHSSTILEGPVSMGGASVLHTSEVAIPSPGPSKASFLNDSDARG